MHGSDVDPLRPSLQMPLRPLSLPREPSGSRPAAPPPDAQEPAGSDTGISNRDATEALLTLGKDLDIAAVLERIVGVGCSLLRASAGVLGVVGRRGQVSRVVSQGIAGLSGGTGSAVSPDAIVCPVDRCHGDDPRSEACLALAPVFGQRCPFPPTDRSTVAPSVQSQSQKRRPNLVVPVTVDGVPYAYLVLSRDTTEEFCDADVARAGLLGRTAATAIGNALMYERAQRREAWLHASLEIEQQLLAGYDRQEVMDLIADRARRAAGADVAAIVLPVDPENFVVESVAGSDFVDVVGRRIARDGTLSAQVMSTGQAEIVEDATSDTRLKLPAGVPELGSGVVAPLTANGRPVGALLIGSLPADKVFSEVDVQLVSTFASHAALALELARAQEDRARLAVYEDRERIALDLHDLVIQRLFAAGLALQTLRRFVPSAEALNRVEDISADLDGTIMDIRATIFGLQRSPDSPQSLRRQITEVVDAARQTLGFSPRVRMTGPIDRLVPSHMHEHVLAVLREGLSNVWRHARATSVVVIVSVTGEALCVEVVDDGEGLGASTRRSGLDNLRARAERLGGTFQVADRAGKGTRLCWRVPMADGAFG